VKKDFESKLDVSWLFHDNALEGVVLSYSELKAAIDQRIISDVSLIPMYEEVRNHKLAVDFIRRPRVKKASGRGPGVHPSALRMVTPDAVPKGCPYRKENPLTDSTIMRSRHREDRVQDAQARGLVGVDGVRHHALHRAKREDPVPPSQAYPGIAIRGRWRGF